MESIKQWLATCRNERECLQRETRGTQIGIVLNVIDCQEDKVLAAPANCHYLALSYVWGRKDVLAFSKAPQVVLEAMRVTLKLGQRYLWVNKYCIFAANEDMKQYQLSHMDQFYSSAFATMVAAAGTLKDHGLCGISRVRVDAQPSVMLPGIDGLKLAGNEESHLRLGMDEPRLDITGWSLLKKTRNLK